MLSPRGQKQKITCRLLSELELTQKDLFPTWYKADKKLKYRVKGQYHTTNLRIPYQYMVAMLWRLYGELDAPQFPLSYLPLIYLCAYVGASFNWADILSMDLKSGILAVTWKKLGNFPNFHMDSYLLDIMCIAHKYPNMGWSWLSLDFVIHIYNKVL